MQQAKSGLIKRASVVLDATDFGYYYNVVFYVTVRDNKDKDLVALQLGKNISNILIFLAM